MPFAGQHAIQAAAVAMDFATQLDVGEVTRLRAAAEALRGDFPIIADQQRTTLHMPMGPDVKGPAPAAVHDVGGFIMDRPAPSAPPGTAFLRRIIVSRENVVVIINDYTRWDKFKSSVEKYCDALLASINAQKGVSSIGLQITDVFNWIGDPAEMSVAEIFQQSTPYLAHNAFDPAASLWHSHHGYIVERQIPLRYSQLDNINISRTIVDGGHRIEILTSHKATFERPLYKVLDANRAKISSVLDTLHLRNKEILGGLLAPEVQAKINLNSKVE